MLNPATGSLMIGGGVMRPRRILIVGDLALSRLLIRMVLTRLGYAVTSVASGQDALGTLSRTRFTLALIALHLPDLPGLALASRLRDTPGPVSTMPIMLFGDAWDQDAVLEGCREARLQGYLPKPVSIARLVSSVCDLVRRADPTKEAFMNSPQSELFQLQRLLEFTGGDDQLERELSSLYLSTATLYLTELRGSLADRGTWRSTAHALKGASANIGAVVLAQLAAEAEQADPAADRLDALHHALEEVRRFFRERAANRTSSSKGALAHST